MAQKDDKISFAGDVNIEDVTLISSTGFAQDISAQVMGIEIYEDMFSSFTTGKLIVRDSQELSNLLPLIGEETLRIKFQTPSLPEKDAYQGEYFIYKMDDRMKIKERELAYVLHFISKDAINDMNKKVSRAYSGKISDIVEQILVEPMGLNTVKKINIEETQNSTKFISNWWCPTQNLQQCCDTAVNANNSPSYLFFENKYGLNFASLDTLYTGTPLMQRFIWDNYTADIQPTGSSTSSLEKDYQRVVEFQMSDTFNYMDRLKAGMYGSEIIYYDILTKQYVHKGYGPIFTESKHLNEYPLYSDNVPIRSKAVIIHGNKYYNNFDGYDDVTNLKTIQKRKSLLAQAEAYKVTISVFGRTDYSCGQRVYIEVPRNAQIPKSDPDYEDKLLSGNYLISAICHFITREKHECTMELIKDSFRVNLNDPK